MPKVRRMSATGRASSTSAAPTRSLAITLDELRTAEWLREGDGWVSGTLAQQTVARLLERQIQGERGGARP